MDQRKLPYLNCRSTSPPLTFHIVTHLSLWTWCSWRGGSVLYMDHGEMMRNLQKYFFLCKYLCIYWIKLAKTLQSMAVETIDDNVIVSFFAWLERQSQKIPSKCNWDSFNHWHVDKVAISKGKKHGFDDFLCVPTQIKHLPLILGIIWRYHNFNANIH